VRGAAARATGDDPAGGASRHHAALKARYGLQEEVVAKTEDVLKRLERRRGAVHVPEETQTALYRRGRTNAIEQSWIHVGTIIVQIA
jgi:hypothetical protein